MDSNPEILESLLEISSSKRMIRGMAWVLRLPYLKVIISRLKHLTLKNWPGGEALIQTVLQGKYFSEEIWCVHKGVCLPSTSCLNGLHPFIDSQQGILRLSSRLGLSELPYDKKYPIILPRIPHVVALIRGVHLENNHSGVGTMVLIIRQRIWIPGLKGLAVQLKRSGLNCQHHDSQSQITPEPPLPVDRVVLTAPFSIVGVNHAGPLYARDAGKTKFYFLPAK